MTHDAQRIAHNAKRKVIVALDVDNLTKARHFVDVLYPAAGIFKIGSQLFTACGPQAVEMVRKKGAQVFLDLKFHDIPNTVANAVHQAVRLKVTMLTLHIQGGAEMLSWAVKAAEEEARRLHQKPALLLGVTILTSQQASKAQILKLAQLGKECGLDGVICSAREVALLRKELGRKFILVTPGIRTANAAQSDQKRTATARQALQLGSDFLVVGRPILEAPDPLRAIKEIF